MDDHAPASVSPRTSAATKERLGQAFAAIVGSGGFLKLGEAERTFITQILEDFDPDELGELPFEDLSRVIAGFWTYGEVRSGQQTLKRVTQLKGADGAATAFDLVEIVQPDSPFIVETVMGELIDQGVSIRSMFHPVVTTLRDGDGRRAKDGDPVKESMMLVVIEHLPAERHAAIMQGIDESLNDLKLAVLDFPRMLKLLRQEIDALEALRANPAVNIDPAVIDENLAFLRWIDENHFVFLGARGYAYPRSAQGVYESEAPLNQLQEGFGVLRDAARQVLRRSSEPAVLSAQLLSQLENSEPVTVAKANIKSRVHRRVYMDYIGIKRYGADGMPSGEVRFVGLFTSEAYDRPAFEVPLIRRKAEHVLHEAAALGLSGGYNEKRLKNIVETYPRDELFQVTEDDLLRIARGILHLSDRPRVRLFTRTDPFDRFISVLLYVPRELYKPQMQKRAGEILAAAYLGRVSASYAYINESLLSCVHYIIGVTPGDHFDPDINDLEADIANIVRSWPQQVEAQAESGVPGDVVLPSGLDWQAWADAFPADYRERYTTIDAATDIAYLANLSDDMPVNLRAYQRMEDDERVVRFKLYTRTERSIPLSDILPVLANMGLKTLEEYGYNLRSPELGTFWAHEFILRLPRGHASDFAHFRDEFESTLLAVNYGKTEDDGFNALALMGQSWREVALLRTLSRYRVQSGLDPSPDIQQAALRDNPEVVLALLGLFNAKFAPDGSDKAARDATVSVKAAELETLLQAVASLEHDRVLRRLYLLIMATRRTNYFQDKPYISFKVASRELADLPEPKPYREIFVWSPRVEGVHLRFGPVARGGLRWSDRREDFRTEVLGLVKAQQVKNAVIVPVGSKGGFFPKKLPRNGTPDLIRAEAVRAYTTFLSGLLDLTDNIDAKGRIVAPARVVCWDDPDPYLVVAADKGTATFSDIANGVSADYGFWLGDAFASGGSVGYDHKAMGITAKGAWEAVKRHFREMGKDIQTQAFTCAGIGDMSGDVFGNGMLLSMETRLVAAFDHRDIFIDPNPDPTRSFQERARIFALPRSSWQDYDKALISKGGGVFPRSQKSIPVSQEMKTLLDLSSDDVSPFELMQAILKARVELLYFGGIGTYIKAPSQSHVDVGDKANDAIRIDGTEVRARVIGEGANLGLTQAGRISCAESGVRLNTDAIDNSAGVDCSDHEVNIKILLGQLVAAGKMTMEARDKLLASMTDDVARHVLRHNYNQTLALTLQESTAVADNANAQAFMTGLEKRGRLDRKVEGLPSNAVMEARRAQGRGLTRPELAVVTAYSKLVLFDDIVASTAPDDPALQDVAVGYFPPALHGFGEAIASHRLRREIISTVLANEIVNITTPDFPARALRGTGVDVGGLVLAFEAARRLFGIPALWAEIDALDNQAPAGAQTALYQELSAFVRRQTYWIARRNAQGHSGLEAMVAPYVDDVRRLLAAGPAVLSDPIRVRIETRAAELVALGAPAGLAGRIALLAAFHQAPDIIDLAAGPKKPVDRTAELYFLTGDRFGFDRLRLGATDLASADPWDRMATRRLIEDVLMEQKAVVKAMMARMTPTETPLQIIENWEGENRALIDPLQAMIADMQTGGWSFAKLTIVNAVLREWVARVN